MINKIKKLKHTKLSWDYVAGFFDGEGNLHVSSSGASQDGRYSLQVRARFYSSTLKVLKELQKFICMGTIYVKHPIGMYELCITSKQEVKKLLINLCGRVVIKRDQINFLLKHFDFNLGSSNIYFDVEKFRSFITRKNVFKFRKLKNFKESK